MGILDWLKWRLTRRRPASMEMHRDEHPPATSHRSRDPVSPPTVGRPADFQLDTESEAESDTSSRSETLGDRHYPTVLHSRSLDHDLLIMGADVGTSLSKVVVAVGGRRMAVEFDAPGGEDNPYLLPTAVSVMEDGSCRLGLHDGASVQYDDIKRPLIGGKTDENVQLPLIAFMALLFQHVRKQIKESEGKLLSERLDWQVNLGVPTESYGGGSSGVRDLVRAYRRSAEVAWSLARQEEAKGNERRLMLDQCKRVMQSELKRRSYLIDVWPEFAAQVRSYATSKQRQEGVHVFVDAGGGTLDVTVFQVLSSLNYRKTPVWARTVQPLGARYLVDHIAAACSQITTKSSGFRLTLTPFTHVPSEVEIAKILDVSPSELSDIVEPFRRLVVSAIGETIRETGKYSLQWPGRLFLVGGGAFIELYKGVAMEFERKEWKFRIHQVPLPRPEDLVAPEIDDAHWHRLAVAYGLSDPFNIRDIDPPEDLAPVDPPRRDPPENPPPWTGPY